MLSENEFTLLSYLIGHCQAGRVKSGAPETYLPYSKVYGDLRVPNDGRTPGESLNEYAMGGLADWLKQNGLPAITGIIINKLTDLKRPGMPSKTYFTFHDRVDMDFVWLQKQVTRACEIDWPKELERFDIRLAEFSLPDEVTGTVTEGACRTVTVNAYERNTAGRNACIKAHGVVCCVCGFDFEFAYGERGKGYIHVHHLIALSDIRREYNLDPVKDLRPVCPNCHAMLHRYGNISISELTEEIAFVAATQR